MKENKSKGVALAIMAVAILAGGVFAYSNQNQESTGLTQIRLGWQTPWATQGQLTQVLANTAIAENNGLDISYNGFDSGAPLNEAAVADQVDVLFTADQPAATLISKDKDWVIIGRLMYNRVSLYVPPESPINTVADLKGKTVAVPFGTAAQKMLLQQQEKANLVPGTDVTNINLGIYEQSDVVKGGTASTWGTIDAMAGFDPTPAIFEDKGLVRIVASDKVVSTIVMSKKFIQEHPESPKQFLASFKEAYEYYRSNTSQANAWFKSAAKLDIPDSALAKSAAIEPNLSKDNDIRLSFTDDDFNRMQSTVDLLVKQGVLKNPIVIKDHVNVTYIP